ncbi:hypothetical protein U9M48_018851 [Paspalum notatum var. saurae]|uniref:Uncharacterized protein n=1 Tax=Paspalum notatum var. saurae TaxID=547442 RepID=A0AAQ3TB05_PASNO
MALDPTNCRLCVGRSMERKCNNVDLHLCLGEVWVELHSSRLCMDKMQRRRATLLWMSYSVALLIAAR